MKPALKTVTAAAIGFTIGFLLSACSISEISFPYVLPSTGEKLVPHSCESGKYVTGKCSGIDANGQLKIYETANSKGAETLPSGVVVTESVLYQHRSCENPDEACKIFSGFTCNSEVCNLYKFCFT